MKSLKIAAAIGLMVAGLGVSTTANAQRYDNGDRRDWHGDRGDRGDWRGDRGDRRDDRGWRDGRRGYYGHDRGYGYNRGGYYRGWRGNRNCRTTYRYHRPVTVCYR